MPKVSDRLEFLSVASLVPAKRNPRTHSERQVAQLAASIERHGFTNPILIDDDAKVIAGHGRLLAAKKLSLAKVPCLRISEMSEAEKRAYVIADNKLALNAGWDFEILALEFQDLIALDFDMTIMGFDQAEVDAVLTDFEDSAPTKSAREDERIPPPSSDQCVTRLGDLWICGRHRLLCGDAKNRAAYSTLMDGEVADMVFTDPPYNVVVKGNVSGLGRHQHREFVEASGEMSSAQFTTFLGDSFEAIEGSCRNGAIVFTCMDWRHLPEILAAGSPVFTELKNICVWSKHNAGMGTFYRSQHEMVLVWKIGDKPHINNFGLGDKGRYRTNVWSYAGVNSFKAGRAEELAAHPTVKPVGLVADAIRDVSHRGDIVLDPFGGSGTTMIAAQKTGRCGRLIELDPIYCDVIVRRWEKFTGKQAALSGTEATFEAVGLERHAPQQFSWGSVAA